MKNKTIIQTDLEWRIKMRLNTIWQGVRKSLLLWERWSVLIPQENESLQTPCGDNAYDSY